MSTTARVPATKQVKGRKRKRAQHMGCSLQKKSARVRVSRNLTRNRPETSSAALALAKKSHAPSNKSPPRRTAAGTEKTREGRRSPGRSARNNEFLLCSRLAHRGRNDLSLSGTAQYCQSTPKVLKCCLLYGMGQKTTRFENSL